MDRVAFGAAANGESFGRYPNGTGELTPLQSRSLNAANGLPRVGPVVISEIMYEPPAGDTNGCDYLELHNAGGQPEPLYDPAFPTSRWQIANPKPVPPNLRVVETSAW